MSCQVMSAVQLHSRFYDEVIPFRIMMSLAWFADENGRVGVEGDWIKCPGQRAIASRARVSKTTMVSWLPKIIKSGEVTAVHGGEGRAAWVTYQINLPIALSEGTVQHSRVEATVNLDRREDHSVDIGLKSGVEATDKPNVMKITVRSGGLVQTGEATNVSKEWSGVRRDAGTDLYKNINNIYSYYYEGDHYSEEEETAEPEQTETTVLDTLMAYFNQITGFVYRGSMKDERYLTDWIEPFNEMYKSSAGNTADERCTKTFERMKEAADVLNGNNPQGRKYIIASPKSLLTTYRNLPAKQPTPMIRYINDPNYQAPPSADAPPDVENETAIKAYGRVKFSFEVFKGEGEPEFHNPYTQAAMNRIGWRRLQSVHSSSDEEARELFTRQYQIEKRNGSNQPLPEIAALARQLTRKP